MRFIDVIVGIAVILGYNVVKGKLLTKAGFGIGYKMLWTPLNNRKNCIEGRLMQKRKRHHGC